MRDIAPSIEILMFDVFGTVVDWHHTIVEEGGAWNRQYGWSVDWSRLAIRWRVEGYFQGISEIVSGNKGATTVDQLHRVKLEQLLAEEGLRPAPEVLDQINRVWHRLHPYPDVLPGLRRLGGAYGLVAFSNGDFALLLNMARNAGLPWDGILSADLIRAWKPDPEAYQRASTLLDVDPREILMVAAHTNDLEAAREAGFQTAFVSRPTEWGAEPAREPLPEFPFDYHVASFEELATALAV